MAASWTRILLPALLLALLLIPRTTATASDHGRRETIDPPSVSIFFNIDDLKPGNRMPIYFSNKKPSNSPHLLSKQESDSIPFSSSHLESLLELFSFSRGSAHARAVESTLTLCELEPMAGETKFCATSLESMLDSVRSSFGDQTQLRALATTTHSARPVDDGLGSGLGSVRNYTILKEPEQILTRKVMGCHTMPYPYLVYYCHRPTGETKLFRVLLGGEGDGGVVEAVALCHMDTSKWDRDNPSFRVLKMVPGEGPVCHFFPRFDIVWAALPV
ncbi:unnamed protein product [Linum trigynum]|uniref:BURP domain-containing protein n=1 Tax=Linum trigynum TaxID=586398 RepID=A0AAV2CC18_9ROSI